MRCSATIRFPVSPIWRCKRRAARRRSIRFRSWTASIRGGAAACSALCRSGNGAEDALSRHRDQSFHPVDALHRLCLYRPHRDVAEDRRRARPCRYRYQRRRWLPASISRWVVAIRTRRARFHGQDRREFRQGRLVGQRHRRQLRHRRRLSQGASLAGTALTTRAISRCSQFPPTRPFRRTSSGSPDGFRCGTSRWRVTGRRRTPRSSPNCLTARVLRREAILAFYSWPSFPFGPPSG